MNVRLCSHVTPEVEEAARRLTAFKAREGFHLTMVYQYTRPDGSPWWWVVRLEGSEPDPTTGKRPKSIWPMCQTENGFELKRPEFGSQGAPLYNLHLLENYPEDVVYLVEGEKCADCLVGLGFIVTTWSNGSQAVERVNFGPLAGGWVVQWPDFDPSGFEAMDKTRGILRGLGARVVTLDVEALGLPSKSDCVDWLARFVASHGARELCAIPEGHTLAWEAVRALPVVQEWAVAA
jgi:hypothetical protein